MEPANWQATGSVFLGTVVSGVGRLRLIQIVKRSGKRLRNIVVVVSAAAVVMVSTKFIKKCRYILYALCFPQKHF